MLHTVSSINFLTSLEKGNLAVFAGKKQVRISQNTTVTASCTFRVSSSSDLRKKRSLIKKALCTSVLSFLFSGRQIYTCKEHFSLKC